MVVLPGPPRELHEMWEAVLAAPAMRELLDRTEPFEELSLRLFGIPESEIAQGLREIEAESDLSGLEITTCLRRAELHVDVRHRGAEAQAESLREGLAERHGQFMFSERGQSIEDVLHELLGEQKLGLAESCTGGLVAARLTNLPRASGYFMGSIVSYSNEAKTELLGVPEEL
ncbi:MAG: CinA family protein, partial [Solirubrobacterales bacterium]